MLATGFDILFIADIDSPIFSLSDLKNVINVLVTKLREWYSYYNPELEKETRDNKKFVDLIIKGERKRKDSIGGEFDNYDQNIILELAGRIKQLSQLEESLEEYIEKNGKKRVYIPEKMKEKLLKKPKVRLKDSKNKEEN